MSCILWGSLFLNLFLPDFSEALVAFRGFSFKIYFCIINLVPHKQNVICGFSNLNIRFETLLLKYLSELNFCLCRKSNIMLVRLTQRTHDVK